MSASASAGRRGEDVRSDCWVSFEPRASGGIEIALTSKVASLYGTSIRRQTENLLMVLGVIDARLEIEDAGALPFVIAARVEAAIRRVWSLEFGVWNEAGTVLPGNSQLPTPNPKLPTFLPPLKPCCLYGTSRDRLRRSRLYLPGNEPKFFLNAGLHKPDGVILDLEDSVAPSEKDAARILVRNALRTVDFGGAERMVRINQGELGLLDLEWIVPHNVHIVLIPKVETAEQVRVVELKIDKCKLQIAKVDSNSSICDSQSSILLMPIIESALGGINAYQIATASPNVVALAIGLEDYTADIGAQRTLEGRESFWLRSQVVNAARAAGVQPIDSVFSDVGDMDGLRQSVLEAKALGFDGKGCIHPRQIPVVHQAFAADPGEVARAQKIVAAFEKANAQGLGVVSLGSKMIDPPVVKRALRMLKMAERMKEERGK